MLLGGGLVPKSDGFAIGIAKALPEQSQARPLMGRKQISDSEKDFRRGMRRSLKSYERVRAWLSSQMKLEMKREALGRLNRRANEIAPVASDVLMAASMCTVAVQ